MGNNPSDHSISDNRGGSTDYYKLPEGATDLQDLIEYRGMNFAVGNIFKAAYMLGIKSDDTVRDLNKIVWFAKREINRIEQQGVR